MSASAMRRSATGSSTGAKAMDIAPPVTASAPPPADISPPPAAAAAHNAHASRQSGQHGDCQPDLDPVNQGIVLFHIR
jgi:hypothetical protein